MTISPREFPRDVKRCHALLQAQAATIALHEATIALHEATSASQAQKIEELTTEMEKLRKLLSRLVNGHRSEKRVLPAENQGWLPFENSEEFQAARAEAEAQAEAIVMTRAWRPRWSRRSGFTTCRSTGTRTCSPAAAGYPAARRC